MVILAEIIHRIIQLLVLVLIAQAFLTFFMDPFHPVRRTLDRVVEPLYAPIRRIIPPVGMFDFSPLILIVLLQILDMILRNILYSLS